jgi:flagellar basal-body rod protein FlgB
MRYWGLEAVNLFGGELIETIKARMAWASERQSVLARNIANASTPDFLPSDMNEKKFSVFLRRERDAGGPAQGQALRAFGPRAGARITETFADGETTPNGNGVNLERQMMKAAENSLEYQQAAGLYRKALGMWRSALGGRGA